MDFDLSLDDVLLSAYRLSWPKPAPKPANQPERRPALLDALRDTLPFPRRQDLQGWAIPLSAPAA